MSRMECQQVGELLSPYLDNELDTVTTIEIAGHLETCCLCQQEFRHLAAINRLLKGALTNSGEMDLLSNQSTSINGQVRKRIQIDRLRPSSINSFDMNDPIARELFSSTVVKESQAVQGGSLSRPRTVWRVVRKFVAAAAAIVVTGFLGLFGFIYWSHSTGPLLAGTVRTHRLCMRVENLMGGGKRTNPHMTQIMAHMNTTTPQLTDLGFELRTAHQCRIYKTSFVHLVYVKGDKLISLFYGSKEAVARLCETEGPVQPGKICKIEDDGLKVTALTTHNGENLWLVAGELSEAELQAINSKLMGC